MGLMVVPLTARGVMVDGRRLSGCAPDGGQIHNLGRAYQADVVWGWGVSGRLGCAKAHVGWWSSLPAAS